jgi:AraC-like DNA-binding protein
LRRRVNELISSVKLTCGYLQSRCGLGGTSQFSRAFRARFGMPPRQYLALVRQQDLDWHEARLIADGFDPDAFLWRQEGLS